MLAIRRFSDPPVLEDLEGLVLDRSDLDAIRRCRPGDCDIRLGGAEIQSLQDAAGAAGSRSEDAVQQEFRQVVLRRVNAYRSGGLAMLPPYADRREYTHPQDAFEAILDASASLKACLPDVVARLRDYPRAQLPGGESFFYWSKEQYGAGKRVVAVTHVEIVKPAREHPQEVIVLGKEIFATHYRNASLGTTAIVREPVGNARYLVYINRSHVDALGGLFGGLKRKLIEGRLKAETAGIIRHVRDRMSGGAPPTAGP